MGDLTVAAFFTDGPDTSYEDEAGILRASLNRVGMFHHIRRYEDRGGWDENTAIKPRFIREMRRRLRGPLLYLDVDAFVHEDCSDYFTRLADEGVDFAAHWFRGPAFGHDRSEVRDEGWWMLSGTLFFGDTVAATRIIDSWIAWNRARELAGTKSGQGQKNLQAVVPLWERDPTARIKRIPGRFCYVFDKPWAYPDDEPRIIEHTIASREHRGASAGKISPARRKRIAEFRELLNE